MKIAVIVVRVLMGLLLLFSSVVVLFKLVPQPPMQGDIKLMNDALFLYLMPIVKVIELICALAFISGFFVPLATIVIFPITVNILLFHVFMAPESLLMALFLFIANLFLAGYYRDKYKGIFDMK